MVNNIDKNQNKTVIKKDNRDLKLNEADT